MTARRFWWWLAGIGYGLGEWATRHIPECQPDEEQTERMLEAIREATGTVGEEARTRE